MYNIANKFELLQTIMKKIHTFFDRMLYVANKEGYKNLNELAKALGYKSPEKLYRLERDKNASPSFQILTDISNLFESIDMSWLITGNTDYTHTFKPVNNIDSVSDNDITPLSKTPFVHPLKKVFVPPTVHPTHEKCQICTSKDAIITEQRERITDLKDRIEDLRDTIDMLKEQIAPQRKSAS